LYCWPSTVSGSTWRSGTIFAITLCALMTYLVVTRHDDISELKVAGAGIAFRGNSSPRALPPPEEQRGRSRQIEANVEEEIRDAPAPSAETTTAVELTGTWTMLDDSATWTITIESGYLVFREQNTAAPGIISAVGFGSFDGRTWSLQVQTIVGTTGTAALNLQDDGTLQGEANVGGVQFQLALRR
jgi:hypothetical protein